MASTAPSPPVGSEEHRPFRWTALWIGALLIAILATAILVGALIHNLNQTRMVAIFAIGVVSFLGTLAVGRRSRSPGFEPAEVRTALTTSFTMVFFAAVAIFLFSTNTVGDFGRTLMDNLTSLFGVVIGFYFASSAAVEYAKVREGGRAPAAASGPEQGQPPAVSSGRSDGQAALEVEVAALRSAVEALTKKVEHEGG